jgi:cytoplasmic iron level regulating protein YaaA (DUF328/UPF0246 family)
MAGRSLEPHTIPVLLEKSRPLVEQLSALSRSELAGLMKMSDKLAALTYERYQSFTFPFTFDNARQSLLVFQGDQFSSLATDQYTEDDFLFAQEHLRILSGLYGVLRPLDLIQPYRLEMATRLANEQGENLYRYWQGIINEELEKDLLRQDNPVVVNLASDEYFKVLQPKKAGFSILKISFKEMKNNKLRVIAIHAKRARGLMVDDVICRRLTEVEELKTFSRAGYQYCEELSSNKEWVFSRLQE